jgi:regulator of nonsense transcripts 2
MKTQQAAEREEQQRIKNLVLNYDLRDGEEQDGDLPNPIPVNSNIHMYSAGIEKAAGAVYARPDKSVNNRSGQRARKLQLSDVDWYDRRKYPPVSRENSPLPFSPQYSLPPDNESFPSLASASHLLKPRVQGPPNLTGRGRLSRREILQAHSATKASMLTRG